MEIQSRGAADTGLDWRFNPEELQTLDWIGDSIQRSCSHWTLNAGRNTDIPTPNQPSCAPWVVLLQDARLRGLRVRSPPRGLAGAVQMRAGERASEV